MTHTINISEELWEAYDGSPSKMRDTLWQALVPASEQAAPREFQKTITLQWQTNCSICRKLLLAGETAVYRVPDDGPKQIICMDDVRGEATLDAELLKHSVKV